MKILSILFGAILFCSPLLEGSWDVWEKTIIHSLTAFLALSFIFLKFNPKTFQFSSLKACSKITILFVLLLLWLWVVSVFASVKFYSGLELHNWINYFIVFFIVLHLQDDLLDYSFYLLFGGLILLCFAGLHQYFFLNKNSSSALMINPNIFAGYLIMAIPLLFYYVKRKFNGKINIFHILLLFSFAALLLTKSASAFFALISAVAIVKYRYRGLALSFVIFLCILVFKMNNPDVIHRYLWAQSTLNIIKDNLFTGTGPGSFEFVYQKYRTGDLYSMYSHNFFLQMTSETGLAGFIIYAALIYFILKKTTNSYFKIALSAILIQNLFEYNLYIPANSILFWTIAAMAMKSRNGGEACAVENNLNRNRLLAERMLVQVIPVLMVFMFLNSVVKVYRPTSYYNKGENSVKSNDLKGAIAFFKKAKETSPDIWMADSQLMNVYLGLYRKTKYTTYLYDARNAFEEAGRNNKYIDYYFKYEK